MDITAARSNLGLSASAAVTSTGVSGSVEIGTLSNTLTLTTCDVAYSVRARIVAGSDFVLVTATNTTSGSDAWSAGTAQVETATAVGTITLAGDVTVTVTAAGMTGSPKAISVAVALSDTAATWAGKVRTALAADADVTSLFTVGGSSTTITLTRNASAIGILPANDGTLNIALDNGTCTGITTAATSTNTTAGVASSGANIDDGDAKDFEGITIPTITTLKGLYIKCATGTVVMTSTNEDATIRAGEFRAAANNTNSMTDLLTTLNFNATTDADIYVTVVGATT